MTDREEGLRARELAAQFRAAIEHSLATGAFNNLQHRPPLILSFPTGCCELVSELLRQFLFENGIESLLVYGDCWDDDCSCTQSHVWLVLKDGTVIDITGDQFKGRNDILKNDVAVYCDLPNEFYSHFKIDEAYSYEPARCFNDADEQLYQIIINHLWG